MAKFDGYAFPDESGSKDVEVEFDGEELDIELVDDTPAEDRGVAPLNADITE
jgi:hypothetical protein